MERSIMPYRSLGIGSVGLLILGLLSNQNTGIDAHIGSTYFVIGIAHIYYACAGFFCLLALIYYALRNMQLNRKFVVAHILVTLLTMTILLYYGRALSDWDVNRILSLDENPDALIQEIQFIQLVFILSIGVLIIAQLLLILAYVFRGKKGVYNDASLLDN